MKHLESTPMLKPMKFIKSKILSNLMNFNTRSFEKYTKYTHNKKKCLTNIYIWMRNGVIQDIGSTSLEILLDQAHMVKFCCVGCLNFGLCGIYLFIFDSFFAHSNIILHMQRIIYQDMKKLNNKK